MHADEVLHGQPNCVFGFSCGHFAPLVSVYDLAYGVSGKGYKFFGYLE